MAEVFVELDNRGPFEHFQECDLAVRCLFVLAIHVVQVDLLQGVLFSVDDISIEVNSTGGTLAEWPDLLVLGEASELAWLGLDPWLTSLLHFLRQRPTLLHSDRLHKVVSCTKLYTKSATMTR